MVAGRSDRDTLVDRWSKGEDEKDEKAKYEKTQMRRKYEKAEEMEKRRRSIEDGCGKK